MRPYTTFIFFFEIIRKPVLSTVWLFNSLERTTIMQQGFQVIYTLLQLVGVKRKSQPAECVIQYRAILKNEHLILPWRETSNVQRRMKKYSIPNNLCLFSTSFMIVSKYSISLSSRSYVCFFIQNSMLDVRCSTFICSSRCRHRIAGRLPHHRGLLCHHAWLFDIPPRDRTSGCRDR